MGDAMVIPQQQRQRKLEEILGRLSARQALALARSLETERALGRTALPTEAILAALGPEWKAGLDRRVPTLCRLACMPFEDFLTDGTEVKQPDGRIRRLVIAPWWQGLQHLAGSDMDLLEAEFRALITGTDKAAAAAFGKKVAQMVRGWTETMLLRLSEVEGDAKLKAIFDGLGVMCDLREVARVLPMAGALRTGIDAVIAVAESQGEARGRPPARPRSGHPRRSGAAVQTHPRHFWRPCQLVRAGAGQPARAALAHPAARPRARLEAG